MQYLVAELKVEKIVKEDPPVQPSYGRVPDSVQPRRSVGEVTRLVIRAKDMNELRRKIAGHMELIDDEIVADPEEKGSINRG